MQSITLNTLQTKKKNNEKFVCLTAYDASFAYLIGEIGIEVVLIGDSLGQVIQGHTTTVPVTLESVVYHTQCVARTNQQSLLMADLPFMSYATVEQAIYASTALIQAGAHMVKMEGDMWLCETVSYLHARGIAVCAHIGLNAQSVYASSGYKIRGKTSDEADRLLQEAMALQQAGARLIVLECMTQYAAQQITEQLTIPTIGIGSGRYCDGQILVLYDLLGITPGKVPRFVPNFVSHQPGSIADVIRMYQKAVQEQTYPAAEHIYA